MRRLFAFVLIACAGRAAAQDTPVTRMTVRPAAAPVPALRYKLLPEPRDLTPGNAVMLYYRASLPDFVGAVWSNRDLKEKVELREAQREVARFNRQ